MSARPRCFAPAPRRRRRPRATPAKDPRRSPTSHNAASSLGDTRNDVRVETADGPAATNGSLNACLAMSLLLPAPAAHAWQPNASRATGHTSRSAPQPHHEPGRRRPRQVRSPPPRRRNHARTLRPSRNRTWPAGHDAPPPNADDRPGPTPATASGVSRSDQKPSPSPPHRQPIPEHERNAANAQPDAPDHPTDHRPKHAHTAPCAQHPTQPTCPAHTKYGPPCAPQAHQATGHHEPSPKTHEENDRTDAPNQTTAPNQHPQPQHQNTTKHHQTPQPTNHKSTVHNPRTLTAPRTGTHRFRVGPSSCSLASCDGRSWGGYQVTIDDITDE